MNCYHFPPIERRDAAHAWMSFVAVLKQDGIKFHEYSLWGWMTAAGTPGTCSTDF
jgi:hypothetical protein